MEDNNMDADEHASDNNGEANGEEKVSMTFNNNLVEGEVNSCETECEKSDENNQTGQETTIKDDTDNSKSNEDVEPNDNDNGLPMTDRDTEKPRGLASVRQERDTCKLMIEELQEFVKHPRGDNDVHGHPDCAKHDALQAMSTDDPSMIVQLKRRFQELEEAVSVHERDLDQEMKLNESFKKMHEDLRDFVTSKCDQRNTKSRFVSSKPVTNVDNGVSHISEHYRQLQGELDEYKQEVQQLKSSLDYNTNQQNSNETSLRRENDNLKKELQKKTRQYELTKKTLDDQNTINRELTEQYDGSLNVHEQDHDQEKKHNESLKKMHKDLQDFVTEKCDQRNTFVNKPVKKVDNVVSHISEYHQQLQGKLDKYKQEVQRLKSSLDYNKHQQKLKEVDLKREIDNVKKELQKTTRQYELTKKRLDDQKASNLELAEKQHGLLKLNSAQKDEIEAVKNKLDQAHQNINIYAGNQKRYESIINQLQGTINEQSNKIQQQTSHIRRQDQTIERLQKNIATLEEEHTKLTLRLSKLEGAHLTRINPNITDFSDVNRPTKLAEKYSELYDNEWTDAYEECTDAWKMDEGTCVATMLDMLRKADAECLKLLQPQRDILKTLSTVTVTLEKPVVKQDTHADLELCSSTKDESTQTDLIFVDPEDQTEPCARIDALVQANTMLNLKELKEKEEIMDTNENNTREDSALEMTEISGRSQCQQYDSSCSTEIPAEHGTQVYDQHPERPAASNVTENQDGTEEQRKEEEQMIPDQLAVKVANLPFAFNVDTGEEIAEIIINGEFTEEQKKAVSDMRRLCGTKLEQEGSISKVIAQKIARERGMDTYSNKNVMTFITKCAQLCWYMAIQEPPVVISFRDTTADENFDKDVYKSYTKVGKKVDFVVWPPLYLYKDGPMLCKGTAQGMD